MATENPVTYSGSRLLILNKSVESIIAERFPYTWNHGILESDLEEIIFDTVKVAGRFEAVFYAPDKIIYRDELFKQKLSHYIIAHERSHELDHARSTTFGRLSRHLPIGDMIHAYRNFYNIFGQDTEPTQVIEGTATLFGMFYGTRPWTLKKYYPNSYSIISQLHRASGGRPITHPEYVQSNRLLVYGPMTEPYLGLTTLKTLFKQTGWQNIVLIKPRWRKLPTWLAKRLFVKRYEWNHTMDLKYRTNPIEHAELNAKVETGDIIIRTVPPKWVTQLTELLR